MMLNQIETLSKLPIQLDQPERPLGCVYEQPIPNDLGIDYISYIIEMEPRVVTLHFSIDYGDRFAEHEWRLTMPWQYFYLRLGKYTDGGKFAYHILRRPPFIGKAVVLWSPEQRNSTDDFAIFAQIPNNGGSDDGTVCIGSWTEDQVQQSSTFVGVADDFVQNFYENFFNEELYFRIPYGGMKHNCLDAFERWAAETKRDPTCWKNWDWLPLKPIKSLLYLGAEGREFIR